MNVVITDTRGTRTVPVADVKGALNVVSEHVAATDGAPLSLAACKTLADAVREDGRFTLATRDGATYRVTR